MDKTEAPAKASVFECFDCSSTDIEDTVEDQSFGYGTGKDAVTLSARVPVRRCRQCGFAFGGPGAEQTRHEAVCRHFRVLTPREIREKRTRRGLTQVQLADLIRCGEASIKRWENGTSLPNGSSDYLLRMLESDDDFARLKTGTAAPSSSHPVAFRR